MVSRTLLHASVMSSKTAVNLRERSGSVIECLIRDRRAAGSSLTDVTELWFLSKPIYPSLVLVQPRKTRPCLTERLLMGCEESNQTKAVNLGYTLYHRNHCSFVSLPLMVQDSLQNTKISEAKPRIIKV